MERSRKFFHARSGRTAEFNLARTMMALVLVFLLLNMVRLVLCFKEVLHLPSVEMCYENDLPFNVSVGTYLADFIAR